MPEQELTDRAFARLVTALERFGNTLSDDHETALFALVEAMTAMANGTMKGRYAFGLPTGMGKTRAIIAWVSALHALGLDKTYSIAVAASKVEALCQMKRDLISEGVPAERIGLLHSYRWNPNSSNGPMVDDGYASEPSTEANDERPIMLITHSRIRGGNLTRFNAYRGKPRHLLIWDESLIVSDSSFIVTRLLAGSIGFLERAYGEEAQYTEFIAYLNACAEAITATLIRLKEVASTELEGVIRLPACNLEKLAEFKAILADLQAPQEPLITLLDLIPYPLRVVATGQGGVVSYRVSVPSEIQNILVLDASQPIRKLVHLDSTIKDAEQCFPSIQRLKMPLANLKRFDQVTLYQMHSGGGRSTLQKDFAQRYRQDRKIAQEIIDVVRAIPADEGVLIFTYKSHTTGGPHYRNILLKDLEAAGIDISARLQSGESRLNIVTWGMETSLNNYAYCSHVILAGVLQRNPVDIAGAYLGQTDNLRAKVSAGIVKDILLSEAVHVIYQALSRGTCRVVANGVAKPMTGYLIHRDDAIQEELEKVMPGVGWESWKARYIEVKPGTINALVGEVSTYLQQLPSSLSRISTRQIKKSLNLTHVPSMTFTHAIQKLVGFEDAGWILTGRSLVRGSAIFADQS
ncbi:MAG: hypothetical protein H8K05_19875 [Nitrospira sp.]|nr:hypothetical protein [Nitrospira sp.]